MRLGAGKPTENTVKSDAFLLLLFFCSCILIFSHTLADPDLWGHLRFGLDKLDARSVIFEDPYSYVTSGGTWVNHEWLAEVTFAVAWLLGGSVGLNILKLVVGMATIVVMYRHLTSLGAETTLSILIILLLGTPIFLTHFRSVRPLIYTVLFYTILMLSLWQAEREKYGMLWILPFMFVLWTNLHGGFLSGVGILGIWTASQVVFNFRFFKKALIPVLLSGLAILVNPYGLDLILFLLKTATVPRPEIMDWEPLRIYSEFGAMYGIILVVSILGLAYTSKRRQPVAIILLAVTAFLSLTATRHLIFFAITAVVFISEHIISAWRKLNVNVKMGNRKTPLRNALYVFLSICLLALAFITQIPRIFIDAAQYQQVPYNAVRLLQRCNVEANLATEFGWGEYIIWHLGPNIKVSLDGRRETVYNDEVYAQAMNFMYGIGDWDALLRNYRTDLALISVDSPTFRLLQSKPGWELCYQDQMSALFVNQDSPVYDTVRQTSLGFIPQEPGTVFP